MHAVHNFKNISSNLQVYKSTGIRTCISRSTISIFVSIAYILCHWQPMHFAKHLDDVLRKPDDGFVSISSVQRRGQVWVAFPYRHHVLFLFLAACLVLPCTMLSVSLELLSPFHRHVVARTLVFPNRPPTVSPRRFGCRHRLQIILRLHCHRYYSPRYFRVHLQSAIPRFLHFHDHFYRRGCFRQFRRCRYLYSTQRRFSLVHSFRLNSSYRRLVHDVFRLYL